MQLFDRFNLGHGFRKYFEILPALDEASRDDVFRIRHEVYCQELAFEPVRPDARETDEYDAQSLHCLLRTSHDRRSQVVRPPGSIHLFIAPQRPYIVSAGTACFAARPSVAARERLEAELFASQPIAMRR